MSRVLWSLSIVLLATAAQAALPEAVPLWADGAPHAVGSEESDTPSIRVYLPEDGKATGCGVVICPGGGYGILATDHEGHQVAKWLARQGVAGFVLRYRHSPKYKHPMPMEDAQRAIRYVRHNAKQYGVDPGRVGILGFSAGGHLTSTVATHYDRGKPDAADPIDHQSCRPDFAVLCYAVVNFVEDWAHKGSSRNLLGPAPDPELLNSLCNDTQVTKDTPPTFIFHTAEDPAVPVQNAVAFFSALKKAGVPAEMHIYQDGPHGVGLSPADPAVFGWKDRLHIWLKSSGFLAAVKRSEVSGKLSVNGTPLRWGMIAFVPENPNAPRAWAMVSRGSYKVPASRGAVVGVNKVEVYNLGDVQPYPTQDDYEVIYSAETSPLTVKVAASANTLDFDIKK
jgi:acetyl esterase/lipase